MLRNTHARRAGKLLGAATVTGVMAFGVLAAAPAAAAQPTTAIHVTTKANGIGTGNARLFHTTDFANGI